MQVVYQRCAGLDVHKKSGVACVLVSQEDGSVHDEVRTFGTMTADVATLSTWLREQQVECVAMESTGVFWWPVFNILEEDGHAVVLVNPPHMKAVPGHKTDVADSTWLADLLRHGLLAASFIPPTAIRELRALLRYRKTLIGERAQEINRLQKVLEGANIKLAAVAPDILGVSGRQMIEALATGEEDPEILAELARGRMRAKLDLLRRALEGRVKLHHRVLIRSILQHTSFLEEALAPLDQEVERCLAPFQAQMTLLQSIPGVSRTAAATLSAEIGVDMSRFASAKHLASWAGICPGNRQSGGTRHNAKTTNGNVWLRGVLGEIAWGASHTKERAFGARFRRSARRQNKYKAVVAVMHHVLIVVYCVLREQTPYRERGPEYYAPQDAQRKMPAHVRYLEELGYTVTRTPKEAA